MKRLSYAEWLTTTYKVRARDGNRCVLSGVQTNLEKYPHHCFFKSEYYGKDRDEMWNLVTINIGKHGIITNGWGKERRELDEKCKQIALARYRGKNKDKLIAIMKSKRYKLNKKEGLC